MTVRILLKDRSLLSITQMQMTFEYVQSRLYLSDRSVLGPPKMTAQIDRSNERPNDHPK